MSDTLRRRRAGGVCQCSASFLSLGGCPQVAFHCSAGIGQSPALGEQRPSERGPSTGPRRKWERDWIRKLAFPSARACAGLAGGAADDAARQRGSRTEARPRGELHGGVTNIFWIA